jgi:hypothetical protein
MSDAPRDSSRLQAELGQLRAALRTVEAAALDEAALRAQFREAQQQRARNAAAKRAGGSWWLPPAAAAAVVLAVGGVLAAVVLRGERATTVPVAAEAPDAPEAASPVVAAFQPLLNSPGLSPASSYSVVRVRIPLSAFAAVPGTAQGGTIEADLLVGEDGLAHAIRFDEADALLVSVADQ